MSYESGRISKYPLFFPFHFEIEDGKGEEGDKGVTSISKRKTKRETKALHLQAGPDVGILLLRHYSHMLCCLDLL
ncbi:hypothetical protein ACLOJK_022269, partial [Asimina triloba]